MKKSQILLIISLLALSSLYYTSFIKADSTLLSKTRGKILLQVEANGEAWYVNPLNEQRYYLGRPKDAFQLMRDIGLGITNADIKKIKIAESSYSGADSDGDGLSDLFEDAIGTDKNNKDTDGDGYGDKDEIDSGYSATGVGTIKLDNDFAEKLAGRIVLQIENHGEAWYINPETLEKHFLGRPRDAFEVMRQTGLGISNENLSKISVFVSFTGEDNVEVNADGFKKFSDDKFSFSYPPDWNKSTIAGEEGEVLFIRNYENDVLTEKKAMITVSYIKNPNGIELDRYKIKMKNSATKDSSEIKSVNNREYLQEVFTYKDIDAKETSDYLKLNDTEMIMINLFSAGNHSYHSGVLSAILKSIE